MATKHYTIAQLFKTSWSELSVKDHAQLILLRDQLTQARDEKLFRAYGYHAISILRLLRKNKSAVAKINIEQAVDCINDLHFIHQPWYTFPVINSTDYIRPDDHFTDITYERFAYADRAFSKMLIEVYNKRNGNEYLNLLCACLYTQQLNLKTIDHEAQYLGNKVPWEVRLVIMHTYANIRAKLVSRYPTLFPAAPPDDEPKPASAPTDTGPLWQGLWFELADMPAFQGYTAAGEANAYTALDYLEKKASENLKSKAHAEARNN